LQIVLVMVVYLSKKRRSVAKMIAGLLYLQMLSGIAQANVDGPFGKAKVTAGSWSSSLSEGYVQPAGLPAANPGLHKEEGFYKSVRKEEKEFTNGPGQPEMSSFQSVNSSNLVDLFSGDFAYNIPLLDVGGYPVNLHYQSGISMDQEASWVGLGWNINPGTITRNMRGLPDDFKGNADPVVKTMSIKTNRTVGVTVSPYFEITGWPITVTPHVGIFHNSYRGWGTETGIAVGFNAGVGTQGALTAGLSLTNNSQNGLDISPSMGFKLSKTDAQVVGNVSLGTTYNSRSGVQALQMTTQVRKSLYEMSNLVHSAGAGVNALISFAKPSFTPTISMPYTSSQFTFSISPGGLFGFNHPALSISGYGSSQRIEKSDTTMTLPGYGYLYYQSARNNQYALLDMNREKDVSYRENTPNIAVPIYTYDTYSISGEGIGGMFRPYRGDIGYMRDHYMSTKSNSNGVGLDFGTGTGLQTGIDVNTVHTSQKNTIWKSDNDAVTATEFHDQDSTFENVYFKNPSEKTVVNAAYIQSVGDDYLMRANLSPENQQNKDRFKATNVFSLVKSGRVVGTKTITENTVKLNRDKRGQVITYLTVEEADSLALDKKIKSFNINSFPATSCNTNYTVISRHSTGRNKHHISEISVLNEEGRRYVYGIPVYNVGQTDVTMATDLSSETATGLVSYTPGVENTTFNPKGKDGLFSKEQLPPYAHSYLLTGILSSDYVDITGDGITEDDLGDAVKFNYSQVYNYYNPFKWRAPFAENKASYNDGLKTDNRDQRGTYSYGEKEIWYLNSVESKTMIATFVLDSTRFDANGVKGENGGRSNTQKLYRLKEINLYTKADYLKNGAANARPIKTVHFEYSYELCQGSPGSLTDSGKLTLTAVWFSYNKNEKGKLNAYKFKYNNNPAYNSKFYDRWGNYKNPKDNPGGAGKTLDNADYPYTLQTGNGWDATKAADSAAPWVLTDIKLPSGGKIKVTYESDDYAYVQNRRAMQFFTLAGFASTSSGSLNNASLYGSASGSDYSVVFVNVTEPATDKADIYRKYLEGVSKLYFKLMVQVPKDQWGSGYEVIPVWADILDYGVKGTSSDKKIWIKLGEIKSGESAFVTTALQFLRLNLPSKAYPNSEPGDNLSITTIIKLLATAADNIKNTVSSFEKNARKKKYCNLADLSRSFVRLDNPVYKKLGGGLRVKKVEVEDYWDTMTVGQQVKSYYGQEYSYTTVLDSNGLKKVISSGVASYEPSVGADENPFRVPFRLYSEKEGIFAPTDYMCAEEPFAETFFPSPSVGYSKVRVQTIHKTRKSATGFEETEFYTTKDFPTLVELTAIDDATKKTFNPRIRNFLKFDAKHYVTLSQGFKVELNDMNGRVKAQSSYAQNDLKNPISYTYNYYKLENDASGRPKLSNTVQTIDSASGVINTNAQIGKEVELMIDVREQTSKTFGVSAHTDVIMPTFSFPMFTYGVFFTLPTYETNRYRSIAVLKIVNRFGILDSVLHIEKGSRVTTRNLVYDGETGEPLLTQTNNEFDDPIYNFSYPAHWAYSGMGPAYKNVGATFKNVEFHEGKMFYRNGRDSFPVSRYFESGDEIWTYGRQNRVAGGSLDTCQDGYFVFSADLSYKRVWAINAGKGREKDTGLYFIDKDGKPYTAQVDYLKIIRSGKRNVSASPVGTITSLKSPIRQVSGSYRVVYDTASAVIAAAAARFKDVWKIDTTLYAKDTIVKAYQDPVVRNAIVRSKQIKNIQQDRRNKPLRTSENYSVYGNGKTILADYIGYNTGAGGLTDVRISRRSFILLDFSAIPKGAKVNSADLFLTPHDADHDLSYNSTKHTASNPLQSTGGGNKALVQRVFSFPSSDNEVLISKYFRDVYSTTVNSTTFGPTTDQQGIQTVPISNLTQDMLDARYTGTSTILDQAISIRLFADNNNNRLCYWGNLNEECGVTNMNGELTMSINRKKSCQSVAIQINYSTCPDTAQMELIGGVLKCYSLKDSFVCKPNIDTSINPYRWGVFGNWRMDRAYTYFDRRKESDPAAATNIRKNGEIAAFQPYWNFSTVALQPSSDTMRWVWNSEMKLFNKRGYEIENHDPLDRFNAGQYGYNQTLPVAVGQNSRNRNMMFDGFEDYDYRTDTCKKCGPPRFIDLTKGGGTRIDTVSHTGRYSMRVSGNDSAVVAVKLIDTAANNRDSAGVSIDVVTTLKIDTIISPAGTGLRGVYKNYNNNTSTARTDATVNFNWGTGSPISGFPSDWFDVTWTGFVQPKVSDIYTFYLNSDDGAGLSLKINGVEQEFIEQPSGAYRDDEDKDRVSKYPVVLKAGQLYSIKVYYRERKERANIRLSWSSPKTPKQVIPQAQLYLPTTTDVSGTKLLDTFRCVRLRTLRPINVMNPLFGPVAGTKVVVSGWVKENAPCSGSSYSNVRMGIKYNGSTQYVTLTPKGNIIEGWQRIEDTLTIPYSATTLSVVMKATSSTAVFFDDLRIHPFNSNMKSFVYDPVNIRLMAELDENNYASFYEYDDDGTLIRVKKETERGIKTIKESRSALLKQ